MSSFVVRGAAEADAMLGSGRGGDGGWSGGVAAVVGLGAVPVSTWFAEQRRTLLHRSTYISQFLLHEEGP